MKIRPRHVERTVGFLAAFVAFCFLQIVWEYRDSHCRSNQQSSEHTPAAQHPPSASPEKDGQHGDKQPPQKKHNPLPITCDIIGLVPAAINLMDEHEGFFVGFFTLVLAFSTTLLWRSTADLYEAGERQLTIAQKALAASTKATAVLVDMERPYLAGGGDFEDKTGKDLYRFDIENHGKTPGFVVAYGLEFARLKELKTEFSQSQRCSALQLH